MCTWVYKIISKTIVNRLKRVLLDVISKVQSNFVPRQQIVDNIMCVQEIIHIMDKNSITKHMALKLDIIKAYDRVNWNFLKAVMQLLGFHANWVSLDKYVFNWSYIVS